MVLLLPGYWRLWGASGLFSVCVYFVHIKWKQDFSLHVVPGFYVFDICDLTVHFTFLQYIQMRQFFFTEISYSQVIENLFCT